MAQTNAGIWELKAIDLFLHTDAVTYCIWAIISIISTQWEALECHEIAVFGLENWQFLLDLSIMVTLWTAVPADFRSFTLARMTEISTGTACNTGFIYFFKKYSKIEAFGVLCSHLETGLDFSKYDSRVKETGQVTGTTFLKIYQIVTFSWIVTAKPALNHRY